MSPDVIPQLSLGTAALIIFLVCAGFVMLRGMTRMLVGSIVFSLSAWIGFLAWQEAPTLSVEWTGKSIDTIIYGLTGGSFLISFFLIRIIVKTIARPFGRDDTGEIAGSSPIPRLAFRFLLALIPTTLICLVGATLIHHSGSVAEIRAFSEKSLGLNDATPAKFSQRLKASIEAALPESWIQALDPLTDSTRLTLAKAISAQSGSPLQPVIDPRTNQPIPRAVIVDDSELQSLAREGKFGTLLRHPLLTKALNDPKTQSLLKDLHL